MKRSRTPTLLVSALACPSSPSRQGFLIEPGAAWRACELIILGIQVSKRGVLRRFRAMTWSRFSVGRSATRRCVVVGAALVPRVGRNTGLLFCVLVRRNKRQNRKHRNRSAVTDADLRRSPLEPTSIVLCCLLTRFLFFSPASVLSRRAVTPFTSQSY